MSIKMNLEFMKESKEILDGIERLTRLIDKLEINNIEIYQENDRAVAKVIYRSYNMNWCQNYFKCYIYKGELEHYFNVEFTEGKSIYYNLGDFGFTYDQAIYLKYGNQNLYIVEKEGVFDEVGTIFSEQELRTWFNNYWEDLYMHDSDDFDEWLKVTVQNGYLKMYILFDVQKDEEYLDELFNKSNN